MVTREDWITNRREKLEATISEHLSHQLEGRLAIGIRSYLNPFAARPRAVRAAAPFSQASFDRVINNIASTMAAEDWASFESAHDVRDENATINAASEKIEMALRMRTDEKKSWER